jgi:chorismate mutase/prephenate dehydrogenase
VFGVLVWLFEAMIFSKGQRLTSTPTLSILDTNMSDNDLQQLRAQIRKTDDLLLKLVAERMDLARQVAQAKLQKNLPVKDYQVEKQVIESSRKRARELGIYEDLAEGISKILIQYSCLLQDEFQGRSRRRAGEAKRKVLIVGGLGPMGQWLAQFFDSFGHAVELQDQRPPAGEIPFPTHRELATAAKGAEVIVLATPISTTARLIDELAALGTEALVFDLCSLKSPLVETIERASRVGMKISSIHPMFGPLVDLLSGRNILLCETQDRKWTDAVADLFSQSTANLVRVPLQKHDELIGYILGLSHLTNLGFATALAKSGTTYSELRQVGSTTFTAQTQVAENVVRESTDLYFEIQAENRFTPTVIKKLRETLDAYAVAIEKKDRDGFRKLMEAGRGYFQLPPARK